jgi:hypothetical protein
MKVDLRFAYQPNTNVKLLCFIQPNPHSDRKVGTVCSFDFSQVGNLKFNK